MHPPTCFCAAFEEYELCHARYPQAVAGCLVCPLVVCLVTLHSPEEMPLRPCALARILVGGCAN